MYVKFWGTRGSIPTPTTSSTIRKKIRQALAGAVGLDLTNPDVIEHYLDHLPITVRSTLGGDTTCLEIGSDEHMLILDAGSGLRMLGHDLIRRHGDNIPHNLDILITHTHWDHIQGLPFFAPAFVPGNHITFHSPFPDLAARLEQQQQPPFFPVPMSSLQASLSFNTIPEQQWSPIGAFRVYPLRLSHPGVSYGYRIEDRRASMVHASDAEYKRVDPASTETYVRFFQDADLLVFDAQYTFTEALDKPDWGHSSALVGAEFARRANVKRLALFHHDPTSTDEKIWQAKEQAEAYLSRQTNHQHRCEVLVAYDGLHVAL
jgi:phosphoribosyl 1,2-cyclic phosphodiesterase